MNIEYYSKSHVLNDDLKDYIEERLARIQKHIPRQATKARIHVDEDMSMHSGEKFPCEISIHVPGKDFRAETKGRTPHEAVDLALDKIKTQADKYKSQAQNINR